MQVFEIPHLEFGPQALAFSPDGALLAVWAWGRTAVLDAATGAVRAVSGKYTGTGRNRPGVGFTADGRWFVQPRGRFPPPVVASRIGSGTVARRAPDGHGDTMRVAPSGRTVYLTHPLDWGGVSIVPWDPLTGTAGPAFAPHAQLLQHIAVSADERWLATADGAAVRVWRLGGPKPPTRAVRKFEVNPFAVSGLVLSGDGSYVALHANGLSAGHVRTGEWWSIPGLVGGNSHAVAFHPTRPVLAFSAWRVHDDMEVVFYDVAARAELKRFAWGLGTVGAPAFSPDGLRCAAASAGKVVVWDVDV